MGHLLYYWNILPLTLMQPHSTWFKNKSNKNRSISVMTLFFPFQSEYNLPELTRVATRGVSGKSMDYLNPLCHTDTQSSRPMHCTRVLAGVGEWTYWVTLRVFNRCCCCWSNLTSGSQKWYRHVFSRGTTRLNVNEGLDRRSNHCDTLRKHNTGNVQRNHSLNNTLLERIHTWACSKSRSEFSCEVFDHPAKLNHWFGTTKTAFSCHKHTHTCTLSCEVQALMQVPASRPA